MEVPADNLQSPGKTDDFDLGYAPRYSHPMESNEEAEADEPLAYKPSYNSVYQQSVPASKPSDAKLEGHSADGVSIALASKGEQASRGSEPLSSRAPATNEATQDSENSDDDDASLNRVAAYTRQASLSARDAAATAAAVAARTAALSARISSRLSAETVEQALLLLDRTDPGVLVEAAASRAGVAPDAPALPSAERPTATPPPDAYEDVALGAAASDVFPEQATNLPQTGIPAAAVQALPEEDGQLPMESNPAWQQQRQAEAAATFVERQLQLGEGDTVSHKLEAELEAPSSFSFGYMARDGAPPLPAVDYPVAPEGVELEEPAGAPDGTTAALPLAADHQYLTALPVHLVDDAPEPAPGPNAAGLPPSAPPHQQWTLGAATAPPPGPGPTTGPTGERAFEDVPLDAGPGSWTGHGVRHSGSGSVIGTTELPLDAPEVVATVEHPVFDDPDLSGLGLIPQQGRPLGAAAALALVPAPAADDQSGDGGAYVGAGAAGGAPPGNPQLLLDDYRIAAAAGLVSPELASLLGLAPPLTDTVAAGGGDGEEGALGEAEDQEEAEEAVPGLFAGAGATAPPEGAGGAEPLAGGAVAAEPQPNLEPLPLMGSGQVVADLITTNPSSVPAPAPAPGYVSGSVPAPVAAAGPAAAGLVPTGPDSAAAPRTSGAGVPHHLPIATSLARRTVEGDPFDAADTDDEQEGGFVVQSLAGASGPSGGPEAAAARAQQLQAAAPPMEYALAAAPPAAAAARAPPGSQQGPGHPGGGVSVGAVAAAVGLGLAAAGAAAGAVAAVGQRSAAAVIPDQLSGGVKGQARQQVSGAAPPPSGPPGPRFQPAQLQHPGPPQQQQQAPLPPPPPYPGAPGPAGVSSPPGPPLPTSMRPSASPVMAPGPRPELTGPQHPGTQQLMPGAPPPYPGGPIPPDLAAQGSFARGPGGLPLGALGPAAGPGVGPAAAAGMQARGMGPPPPGRPWPQGPPGPYQPGAPPGGPRPGMMPPPGQGLPPGGPPGPGMRPPWVGPGGPPPMGGPGRGSVMMPGGPGGPGPAFRPPPGGAGPRPPPMLAPAPPPSPYPGLLYTEGRDTLGRPVVVLNTAMLPTKAKKNDVLQYVLKQLQPLVQREYVIVVLSLALGVKTSSVSSTWALGAYRSLAKPYRKNVKHIVLVQPSAWARALLALAQPFVSKKAAHKVKKVDNLVELSNATGGEVKLESLGARFIREIQYGLGAPPLAGLVPPMPLGGTGPQRPPMAMNPQMQMGPQQPAGNGAAAGGPPRGPALGPPGQPAPPYPGPPGSYMPPGGSRSGPLPPGSAIATPVYGPGGPGPATASRVQGPPPPRPQFPPGPSPGGPAGVEAGYPPAGGGYVPPTALVGR